jgi:hypothetical protein
MGQPQCKDFRAKPAFIGDFCDQQIEQRTLLAEGLAEREELGSNGLR